MNQDARYINRYKAKNPQEVIKNCTNILEDLGYEVSVMHTDSGTKVKSTHVQIKIDGAVMAISNGKGMSEDLAAASGLAEMVERVFTTMVPAPLYRNTRIVNTKTTDFYYIPDEVYKKPNELLLNPNKILSEFFRSDASSVNHVKVSIKNDKGETICVPFHHFTKNETALVPVNMTHGVNGSNGCCAGATKEDALVQGISEIFERHVQTQLMYDNIDYINTLAVIPEDYPCVTDEIAGILADLRKLKPNFIFKLVDCTINGEFPVAGLLAIDKDTMGYNLNLGAYPDYRIAIERCVTEIMQNVTYDTIILTHIFKDIVDEKHNRYKLLCDGVGLYHKDMIFINKVAEKNKYNQLENIGVTKTNIDFLDDFINYFKDNDVDIYFHDFSFSDKMHVFTIISPTFSHYPRPINNDFEIIQSMYVSQELIRQDTTKEEIYNHTEEYFDILQGENKFVFRYGFGCKLFGEVIEEYSDFNVSMYMTFLLAYWSGHENMRSKAARYLNFNQVPEKEVCTAKIINKLLEEDRLHNIEELLDNKNKINTDLPLLDFLKEWGFDMDNREFTDKVIKCKNNLLEKKKEMWEAGNVYQKAN